MIDRNHVKSELKMRIRFAACGTTPVSGILLENALELMEEDEKRIQALEEEITKWMDSHRKLVSEYTRQR